MRFAAQKHPGVSLADILSMGTIQRAARWGEKRNLARSRPASGPIWRSWPCPTARPPIRTNCCSTRRRRWSRAIAAAWRRIGRETWRPRSTPASTPRVPLRRRCCGCFRSGSGDLAVGVEEAIAVQAGAVQQQARQKADVAIHLVALVVHVREQEIRRLEPRRGGRPMRAFQIEHGKGDFAEQIGQPRKVIAHQQQDRRRFGGANHVGQPPNHFVGAAQMPQVMRKGEMAGGAQFRLHRERRHRRRRRFVPRPMILHRDAVQERGLDGLPQFLLDSRRDGHVGHVPPFARGVGEIALVEKSVESQRRRRRCRGRKIGGRAGGSSSCGIRAS